MKTFHEKSAFVFNLSSIIKPSKNEKYLYSYQGTKSSANRDSQSPYSDSNQNNKQDECGNGSEHDHLRSFGEKEKHVGGNYEQEQTRPGDEKSGHESSRELSKRVGVVVDGQVDDAHYEIEESDAE